MRWILSLVVLAGCGSRPAAGTAIGVTPTEYDAKALTQSEIAEGAAVDLIAPPQGGFVLFIGAALREVGEPTVQLRGALLDGSGAVIAEDVRTSSLRPSAADPAVLTPDLRSYMNVSNIGVCPSRTATDRFGQPLTLQVTVTEPSSGRSGSATRTVVPSCTQGTAADIAFCQCECAANFVLGKCSMM